MTFVGSATETRSRRDDESMSRHSCRDIGEEEQQRDGPAPPQPFGWMGVAGDLFVVRRRRCHCIASSSLRDLTSQAPSAYVTVFMKGSTKGGHGAAPAPPRVSLLHDCPAPWRPLFRHHGYRRQLVGSGLQQDCCSLPRGRHLEQADKFREIYGRSQLNWVTKRARCPMAANGGSS